MYSRDLTRNVKRVSSSLYSKNTCCDTIFEIFFISVFKEKERFKFESFSLEVVEFIGVVLLPEKFARAFKFSLLVFFFVMLFLVILSPLLGGFF